MAKILLIDDEASIRNTLKEILEYEKYEVEEASNGEEGLKMIESQQFDLVLCDVKMPKMDGYTFVRHLKKEAEKIQEGSNHEQITMSFLNLKV
jgi:CheY-like chemotaxis protein